MTDRDIEAIELFGLLFGYAGDPINLELARKVLDAYEADVAEIEKEDNVKFPTFKRHLDAT